MPSAFDEHNPAPPSPPDPSHEPIDHKNSQLSKELEEKTKKLRELELEKQQATRDLVKVNLENFEKDVKIQDLYESTKKLQLELNKLNAFRLCVSLEESVKEFGNDLDTQDILQIEAVWLRCLKTTTDIKLAIDKRRIELEVKKRDIVKVAAAKLTGETNALPKKERELKSNTVKLTDEEKIFKNAVKGFLNIGFLLNAAIASVPTLKDPIMIERIKYILNNEKGK